MRHLVLLAFAAAAAADTLYYQPSDADLEDLDHFKLYVWRLSAALPEGQQVTSATLTFRNIRNWNDEANRLYVHMFDTARYSGIRMFYDDNPNLGNYTELVDDFTAGRFNGGVDARGVASVFPVAPGTPDTALFDASFGTTGSNYVYTFSAGEVAALNTYLYDGLVAFGFDPDCHFFNDGVKLSLTTGPATPEPGTLALLGAAALAGLRLARRRRVG
jgi:hypothetical protein